MQRNACSLFVLGFLVFLAQPTMVSGAPYSVIEGVTLVRVDVAAGSVDEIGSIGFPIDCLTFSADGSLYGVSSYYDSLVRIDPDTGAGTLIGSLGVGGLMQGLDLAEDESGELWMLSDGWLYLLDRETGSATADCETATDELGGLAYIGAQKITSPRHAGAIDPGCGLQYLGEGAVNLASGPGGFLYFLVYSALPPVRTSIVRIDPATGAESTVVTVLGHTLIGLAFSPDESLQTTAIPTLGWRGGTILGALIVALGAGMLRFR